jgi:hypothetical protein
MAVQKLSGEIKELNGAIVQLEQQATQNLEERASLELAWKEEKEALRLEIESNSVLYEEGCAKMAEMLHK